MLRGKAQEKEREPAISHRHLSRRKGFLHDALACREEGIHLEIGADGHAHKGAGKLAGKVAHDDLVLTQSRKVRCSRHRRLYENEISIRGNNCEAKTAQLIADSRSRAANALGVLAHVCLVAQSSDGGSLSERIHIVRILHLHHAIDERLLRISKAETDAGKRITLGKRTRDDDILEAANQLGTVAVCEVRIGFVDDDDALEICTPVGTRIDGHAVAQRSVGRGNEEDTGISNEIRAVGRQPKVLCEWYFLYTRPLNVGQNRVQRVARIKTGQAAALIDERARNDGQNIIGSIADENSLRIGIEERRCGDSHIARKGVWIAIQLGHVGYRGGNLWRRRIWIFVGIELNNRRVTGLFARCVAGHGLDVVAKIGHTVQVGEEKKSENRHARRLLQVLNLLALLMLFAAYLVYATETQQQPVYGTIEGTPIEAVCKRLAAAIWGQHEDLSQRVDNSPLLPDERKIADAIDVEMARIRPTHAVRLANGEQHFGNLQQNNGVRLLVTVGRNAGSIHLPEDAILEALPSLSEPLAPRDYRFLIRLQDLNHYFIAPYLFATDASYEKVHAIYLNLQALHGEFRAEFAPFVSNNTPPHVHVCFFLDKQAYFAETARQIVAAYINSAGFYAPRDNCLYLHEPQAGDAVEGLAHGFRLADHRAEMQRITRHEGAHQLCNAYGVLNRFGSGPPRWLSEGIAQYCELPVMGLADSAKLTVLRDAAARGLLMDWEQLVSGEAEQAFNEKGVQRIAYAQSWLLVRALMSKPHKALFFKHLLRADTITGDHLSELMRDLETTPTKLFKDLAVNLQEESSLPD